MKCLVCNKEFTPRRIGQKNCSIMCYAHCVRVLKAKEVFKLSKEDLALRTKLRLL